MTVGAAGFCVTASSRSRLGSNFPSLSKTVSCTPRRDRKEALAYARALETLPVG